MFPLYENELLLPKTMTNVIFTDFIFAFGINPRELARRESSSCRGSGLPFLAPLLPPPLRRIPSKDKAHIFYVIIFDLFSKVTFFGEFI